MARVVICDYLKTKLGKDDPTFTVTVGDQEFEVGEEGKRLLLEQLEGENTPQAPKVKVVEKVVYRDAPPPPLVAAPPGGIQIESNDPFEPGPNSMPEPTQAIENGDDVEAQNTSGPTPEVTDESLIEIPDNVHMPLRPQKPKVAQRIVDEATKFEEGSLPTLTMGARQQRDAMKRLRNLEQTLQDRYRKRAGKGINVGGDMRDKPGYND